MIDHFSGVRNSFTDEKSIVRLVPMDGSWSMEHHSIARLLSFHFPPKLFVSNSNCTNHLAAAVTGLCDVIAANSASASYSC